MTLTVALLSLSLTLIVLVGSISFRTGARVARIEQRLDDLPALLNGTVVRDHEERFHKGGCT